MIEKHFCGGICKVNIFALEKDTPEEKNSLFFYCFHLNYCIVLVEWDGTKYGDEIKLQVLYVSHTQAIS